MMELSKPLQEEIYKIQNDLKTAIQNHQILVLRQKSNPVDLEIKKRLGEVQKHIRTLGETQKILVTKVRNELASKKSLRVNNNNHSENNDYTNIRNTNHKDRSLLKSNPDPNRSILKHRTTDKERLLDLQKNGEHNKDRYDSKSNSEKYDDRSSLSPNVDYGRSLLKTKSDKQYSSNKVKQESNFQESSSEENKVPSPSPQNHFTKSPSINLAIKHEPNEDFQSSWDLEEDAVPAKRSKATLQATPRPSSPQPYKSHKTSDSASNSSEESGDYSCMAQFADDRKTKFMFSLGLMENEQLLKLQNKKSERKRRRRRKCSDQHHWYSNLWDLTVLQKRNHNKYPSESQLSPTEDLKDDECEDTSRYEDSLDSADSLNKPPMCFICRKTGDLPLVICSSCPVSFHIACSPDSTPGMCSTCTRVGGNAELHTSNSTEVAARYINRYDTAYTERLKEKQRLLKKNASLKEELSMLEEKAKDLSVSLVNRVTTVNQLTATEEKIRNSIKKVIDFVTAMQKPELSAPTES